MAMAASDLTKVVSANSGPQTRHAFHALAQMPFMQHQDNEGVINNPGRPPSTVDAGR